MIYNYDENAKRLTLDGQGDLIISKRAEFGIKLEGDIVNTNDFYTSITNHYIIGVNSLKFHEKLKQTFKLIKYIWSK